MADMQIDGGHPDMDYAEHERTYLGFLAVTKWAVIALLVLLAVMAATLV